MKKLLSLFAITICFAILFYPETTIGKLTGSPGGETGSPMDNSDCTSCHSILGTQVTTTNITSNIPTTGYVPGSIYTITANLPPALSANGFEITCEENTNNTKTGVFFITNASETQLVNSGSAVTHTVAGNSLNSWSFDWEAPSAGTGDVTFYGAFIEAGYPFSLNSGDYLTLSTLSISEVQIPCNLTGGSVYIDYASAPWMLNATVSGGTAPYSFSWTDTNGVAVSNTYATPFYTQWCVTITDANGCDTTICQDCIADSAMCGCIMLWMPVCGCDGVQYANSCLADCADVSWTPAIPSGMPGGWLPCNQPTSCEVEIDGDSIICNWGSPQVLTASPTASSNPFVSYVWNTGQPGPTLTVTTPGVYCVTATDSTGCIATECITVTVQDIPIYSAPSPPTICYGDSIVLEIDTFGLSNITWVPNTLVTPPVHRIVDFPIFSTIYVVEAVDTAGCTRRGEILVTVDSCNTSPCTVEINNGTVDIEICDGETAILEATTGFDTYLWTEASTGATLGSTHIITVTDPGLYIVTAIDIINNCVDVDSIEVIVYSETPLNPMTAPNPPMVCLGDSVVIEVNTGFLNYWWNTGNPLDEGEDRVVVYPTQDFTYVVEALDSNGCESREEIEVFVDTCATSFSEINKNKIQIYPNPASEEFCINLNSLNLYNIEIIDMLGRLLLSKKNANNLVTIKTADFSKGTYFIRIQTHSDIRTYKIIIDR